ncbi:MAG: type II toxin-antitoxin system VapB family antitoxin [Bifidobacteriaceae bacterium]|jgi:hypothetical protein|nr:type II toxin-antitoxin system VapB family antitoxin [Bifidobacteriaceae bacterium]
MPISIKNPETEAAVKALAAAWNTSYTAAIRTAAEDAIAAIAAPRRTREAAEAARIAAEWRAHQPGGRAADADALYDDQGLPT